MKKVNLRNLNESKKQLQQFIDTIYDLIEYAEIHPYYSDDVTRYLDHGYYLQLRKCHATEIKPCDIILRDSKLKAPFNNIRGTTYAEADICIAAKLGKRYIEVLIEHQYL